MLAFLAKSGLDLKLGSKHVCGCSTSFWMTMSHEAHGYRLKDYIDIVEEENEGKLLSAHNLDEYQTAWKAYHGDEFQVRLRGMQPTFSASLGREIAFIESIIDFRKMLSNKLLVIIGALLVGLFTAVADYVLKRWVGVTETEGAV